VAATGHELEESEAEEGSPYVVGKDLPRNDILIEYTYIIDLDRLEFRVDFNVCFRLDGIPRGPDDAEWIRYIQKDGSGDYYLRHSTPKEYASSYRPPIAHLIPEDAGATYLASKPQVVDLATWCHTLENRPVLDELSFFAFKTFLGERCGV
jgi:hypothetical protein